jgi:hypothetical protein
VDSISSIDKLITTERVPPFGQLLEQISQSVTAKKDLVSDELIGSFVRKVKVVTVMPVRTSFEEITNILTANKLQLENS